MNTHGQNERGHRGCCHIYVTLTLDFQVMLSIWNFVLIYTEKNLIFNFIESWRNKLTLYIRTI